MAKVITRHGDTPFKDVHPTKTAGRKFKGRDLPPFAGLDGLESKYKHCKQCGFIFDTSKHPPGNGHGNNSADTGTETHPITGATLYYGDPEDNPSGCPFCGASDY